MTEQVKFNTEGRGNKETTHTVAGNIPAND